jgi:hypothetical protein
VVRYSTEPDKTEIEVTFIFENDILYDIWRSL